MLKVGSFFKIYFNFLEGAPQTIKGWETLSKSIMPIARDTFRSRRCSFSNPEVGVRSCAIVAEVGHQECLGIDHDNSTYIKHFKFLLSVVGATISIQFKFQTKKFIYCYLAHRIQFYCYNTLLSLINNANQDHSASPSCLYPIKIIRHQPRQLNLHKILAHYYRWCVKVKCGRWRQ